MKITDTEKEQVINKAEFLVKKGYVVIIKENTIVYSNPENEIIITFEPYSDVSDMSIKFNAENEIFSIGWIAFVRKNLKLNPHEKLNNVLSLLTYIEKNYIEISQINYCIESNKLIDDFIIENSK